MIDSSVEDCRFWRSQEALYVHLVEEHDTQVTDLCLSRESLWLQDNNVGTLHLVPCQTQTSRFTNDYVQCSNQEQE